MPEEIWCHPVSKYIKGITFILSGQLYLEDKDIFVRIVLYVIRRLLYQIDNRHNCPFLLISSFRYHWSNKTFHVSRIKWCKTWYNIGAVLTYLISSNIKLWLNIKVYFVFDKIHSYCQFHLRYRENDSVLLISLLSIIHTEIYIPENSL